MTYYLLIINIISFALYGIDKYFAIKHKFRIPEKTLLVLTIFGGVGGAIIASRVFHHKTKKYKFKIIFFLSLVLWLYIIFNLF